MSKDLKATWRIKDFYDADAELVREELDSLGDSTPQDIVEYAKNPDTELHKCFDWNVESAAHKYWLMQARKVTSMLTYEPRKSDDVPVRVFSLDTKDRVYRPTISLVKNQDSYQRLLQAAIADMTVFKQKYHSLTELEHLFEDMDLLINS